MTVYDYFVRSMQREHAPVAGTVVGEPDYCAAFVLAVQDGVILDADYRCTTCVTLVGLCESLAAKLPGRSVADARLLTASSLLDEHPEIPLERRHAADLAVRALQASIG